MKKKLTINAISAVLSLSLVTASSFALFTSTSSISSNSLVNGTVVFSALDPVTNSSPLALGADPSKGTEIYSGRTPDNAYNLQKDMLPNNELNFAAGDTTSRVFVLKNTGSLDMYYRVYLTNVKLVLKNGTIIDNNDTRFSNYTVNIFGANTHGAGGEFTNPSYKISRVNKFSDITSSNHAVAGILYAKNGNVETGSSSAYKIQVKLNNDADQSLQGAKITFDINYNAVQVANNTLDTSHITYQGFGGSLIDMTQANQDAINWN